MRALKVPSDQPVYSVPSIITAPRALLQSWPPLPTVCDPVTAVPVKSRSITVSSAATPGAGTSLSMISIPFTSGFSTSWEKSMSTLPSLVTVNCFIVPTWLPTSATMS